MQVQLGNRITTFPGKVLETLQPCNEYIHDVDKIRRELHEKGYIFIKNFHNRIDVLNARSAVLQHIQHQGSHIMDTTNHSLDEGVLNPRCGLGCVPFMEGRNNVTHSDEVKCVIAGNHVFQFFEKLFEEKALTFDFKWLRAMHTSGYTGAHIDRVYMSRGSQDLLTMWTPLGDITADMRVLAVCEGSHKDDGFKKFQETYGMCDLEAENISGTGWFTTDPHEISHMGGKWKTANFNAGDVIIFNIRLVHMSTANLTKFIRLSCDTRWQPISHKVDERFVGDVGIAMPKFGVYGSPNTCDVTYKTIESLKQTWGFAP